MGQTEERVRTARRRPGQRRRRRRSRVPELILLLTAVGAALVIRFFFVSGEEKKIPVPDKMPDWVTVDLLPVNPYSRPGTALEAVNGIVVHYVGNPGTTAEQNHSFFTNLALTGETYASSHFLIGLDGEIIQNVPLDEVAYCSSQANDDTISIECCHPDEAGAFTEETYRSLLKLTAWLKAYYHLDTSQVIRHYDVTGKECPRYFVQHPEAWEAFLQDLEQEKTEL